jgi:hypothetical protein
MFKRKAFVGLLLAFAIVFCAFTAGSASAAFTTAGECVKGGTKDFADTHCDTPKAGGDFGHVLFANGVKVDITAVNDLTGTTRNFDFEGKIGAVPFLVECTSVSATGTVTNNAGGAVTWGPFTAKFAGCTSQKPELLGCKGALVTIAPDLAATPTGPHNLGLSGAADKKTGPTNEVIEYHKEGAGTQMGLKLVPSGAEFTSLTFAAACGFGIKAIGVKGSMFATPGRGGAAASSGATAEFTKSSTIGGLSVAGNTATLEGTLTFRKKGGEPLILTTTE